MLYAYLIVSAATYRPIYAGQGSLYRVQAHTWKQVFIKKYGEPVEVGLVITCHDRARALDVERQLIATYDPPFNKARWSTRGGLKPNITDKMRRIRKDEMTRRLADPKFKEKMRSLHLGRKRSVETCKRISESLKGKFVGRKLSIETKQKMGAAKHEWWQQKKMAQLAEALLGA